MRKGFTLVEVFLLVIVLPIVFLLFDGLFKTIASEIPMSVRLIHENMSLLSMLRQVQQDIDRAKGLPKSFAGQTASDHVLLIELSEGVIRYQLKEGRILRQNLMNTQQETTEGSRVRSIPHASLRWKVWERNGQGYAVEIDTRLEYAKRGQWKQKMAQTHLYFTDALGKEVR
jgi:hypothetical protein